MRQATRKKSPGEIPMVRKVFKLDNEYVCSICRSVYASYDQAHQCLESCWHGVLNLPPVVQKCGILGATDHFRCRFCGRDYPNAGEASLCARECRQSKMEQHKFDAEIFRNNRPVLVLRDTDFLRKPRIPVVQTPSKKFLNWKRSPTPATDPEVKVEEPAAAKEPATHAPAKDELNPAQPDGTEEDAMEFKKTEEEDTLT